MTNELIKFPYKKKQHRINLMLGLVWLIIGFARFFLDKENNWLSYFWLAMGLLYISIYYYQAKGKYLTIENGVLKLGATFGKSIVLNEVKQIRHFAGEYVLKSDDKSLAIPITLIENSALIELDEILKSLDAEWI